MKAITVFLLFHWGGAGELSVPMAYISAPACMQAAQKIIETHPHDLAYCVSAFIPDYLKAEKTK